MTLSVAAILIAVIALALVTRSRHTGTSAEETVRRVAVEYVEKHSLTRERAVGDAVNMNASRAAVAVYDNAADQQSDALHDIVLLIKEGGRWKVVHVGTYDDLLIDLDALDSDGSDPFIRD